MGNYESAGGHVSVSVSYDPLITDRSSAYADASGWCEGVAEMEISVLKKSRNL